MTLAAQSPIVTILVVVTLVSACLINCTKQKDIKIISEISILVAKIHLISRGSRDPSLRICIASISSGLELSLARDDGVIQNPLFATVLSIAAKGAMVASLARRTSTRNDRASCRYYLKGFL